MEIIYNILIFCTYLYIYFLYTFVIIIFFTYLIPKHIFYKNYVLFQRLKKKHVYEMTFSYKCYVCGMLTPLLQVNIYISQI